MCHDSVKFQYWLSSENRVRGERNSAEFRLDFSSLPPGELWEVQLTQYAVKCDTAKAVANKCDPAVTYVVSLWPDRAAQAAAEAPAAALSARL